MIVLVSGSRKGKFSGNGRRKKNNYFTVVLTYFLPKKSLEDLLGEKTTFGDSSDFPCSAEVKPYTLPAYCAHSLSPLAHV